MNDMKNESNAYAATHIQTHTNNIERKKNPIAPHYAEFY